MSLISHSHSLSLSLTSSRGSSSSISQKEIRERAMLCQCQCQCRTCVCTCARMPHTEARRMQESRQSSAEKAFACVCLSDCVRGWCQSFRRRRSGKLLSSPDQALGSRSIRSHDSTCPSLSLSLSCCLSLFLPSSHSFSLNRYCVPLCHTACLPVSLCFAFFCRTLKLPCLSASWHAAAAASSENATNALAPIAIANTQEE